MSKLYYGKGINSEGKYNATIGGKMAKSYVAWYNMLSRAYCPKYHTISPTYVDCTVSDEWLDFQDFAEWFENHEYSNLGYHLDKDLLIPGNKIYGSETCCFVPHELNSLLLDRGNARGQYKQGVGFDKSRNKFAARVAIGGGRKWLGRFDTELEAYHAYKKAKEAYVKEKALEWQDRIASDVFDALMRWELDPK